MVRAETDESASLPADQHKLDLAAGIFAANLDLVFRGQPPRRATVIDRRRRRSRNADRLQLRDMLVARDRIAPGPAGDDGVIDRQRQRGRPTLGFDGECKIKHG
jgi:hypothetical protein